MDWHPSYPPCRTDNESLLLFVPFNIGWNDIFRSLDRYRRYGPSCIQDNIASPDPRFHVVECSAGNRGLIHLYISFDKSADFFLALHPTIFHNRGILSCPWVHSSAKRTTTVSWTGHILSITSSAYVHSSNVPKATHSVHLLFLNTLSWCAIRTYHKRYIFPLFVSSF